MRVYHRGYLVNQRGGVSALCFKSPRAISLGKATWTNRDEAVSCPKCLKVMEARKADPAIGKSDDPSQAIGSAKDPL